MSETKTRIRRDHIGILVSEAGQFRRSLQANIAPIGKYLTAENLTRLEALQNELDEARKAINGALHSIGPTMAQLQRTSALEAKNQELARQVEMMAEALRNTGHSDKLPADLAAPKQAQPRRGRPPKPAAPEPLGAAA